MPMHSAIDTGHGMTNWPSNMLEIHHSGEHFVAGGLTVANYSAPWESSVRNLYSPRHTLATIALKVTAPTRAAFQN